MDFFDLACTRCYLETPMLAALHHRYTNLGLVVIGVSMHDDRTALTDYLASFEVPFPVGWVSPTGDPVGERMLYDYGLSSGVALPYGVLVDYRNIVTNLNQGGWNATFLDAMVRRQLARTAPPLLQQRAGRNQLVSWSTIATNTLLEFKRLSPVPSTSWSAWAAYPTNGLTVTYDLYTNQFIQLAAPCTNRATFFRLKKP